MLTMATGPCPLLDLPPELRNTVWELVLADDEPGIGRFVRITSQGSVAVPAILRTSEQTRCETLPMWYGNAHFFTLLWDDADVQSCPSRLTLIGDVAARHICFVRMRFAVRFSGWLADIDLDLGALQAATMVQVRRVNESTRLPERIEQRLRDLVRPLSVKRAKKKSTVADWQALLQARIHFQLSYLILGPPQSSPSPAQRESTSNHFRTYLAHTAGIANKRCPLLTLPPELRNNIYDMVFEEDRLHHPYININKSGYAMHMHALLHVSKQVRSETMGMWHNINTFTLYNLTPASGVAECNLWVDRVGASTVRCVQHIAICMKLPLAGFEGDGAQIFIIDIDLRAQTVEGTVRWRSLGRTTRQPELVSFEDFRQQMYTAVNSWQLRTGKHSGTGKWRDLLRAILAVHIYCWTCVIDPADDQEV
ncbi:hypothetical protein LTR97_000183 [Elasticomyces elasticus]|uniref:Uncharacterized protein n=1 Tax=Elasticomyces elasticus TaxID=574655 RepID=A0AAN8A5D7_9PEZI|nr:hypothetical protein LTR97_000183 [Elasticomyces elasticus]